jgi:preprotein translocase subunit SecA
MLEKIIKSIFGDPSEKKVREITKKIEIVKEFEEKQKDFSL